MDGRTKTRRFRVGAALTKIEREVAEYRDFPATCDRLLKVNEAICDGRPVHESTPEKNVAHRRAHAGDRRRLSRWRQEFNHVRPHDALGGKVPADVYKVTQPRRPLPVTYVYPEHVYARSIYSDGHAGFRKDRLFVSSALAGLEVGIEIVDAMHVRAWFRDVDLGVIETVPDVNESCFEQLVTRRRMRAVS